MKKLVPALLLAAACARIDPQTPRPYPCIPDGGDPGQCPHEWRCGLEGYCHDPAVASAYQCVGDSDCAGGWRCGLDGVCVDPSFDALRPDAYQGPLTAVRLSPASISRADHVASAFQPVAFPGQFPHRLIALTLDGGLTVLSLFEQGLPDGGAHFLEAAHRGLPSPNVLALAAQREQVYVADETGLSVFTWGDDGGSYAPLPLPGGLVPTGLKALHDTFLPVAVVAYGGGRFAWLDGDAGAPVFAVTSPDGGALTIEDMAFADQGVYSALLAATDQGLFAAPYPAQDGGFVFTPTDASDVYEQSVLFPNQACQGGVAPTSGLRVVRFRAFTTTSFGVEAVPWGTSAPVVLGAIQKGRPLASPTGCPAGMPFSSSGPERPGGPDCAACPPGEGVVDFAVIPPPPAGSPLPWRWARCRSGGSAEHWVASGLLGATDGGGTCTLAESGPCAGSGVPDPLGGEITQPDLSSLDQFTFAGARGQLWFASAWDACGLAPVLLDRPPSLAFGSGDRLHAMVPLGGPVQELFPWVDGLGFASFPSDNFTALQTGGIFASVAGEPDWMLKDVVLNPGLPGTLPSLVAERDTDLPGHPTRGIASLVGTAGDPTLGQALSAAVTLPDGGEEVLLDLSGYLYAGDVTGFDCPLQPSFPWACLSSGYDAGTLTVRLGTHVGLPPSSLAATAQTRDASWVSAYALDPNGLQHLSQVDAQVWRASTLDVPSGEWRSVWFDGSRGRLGYGDGTVLGLPSRLMIGPPIPGARVLDFAQLCGQAYALTTTGLFRLVSDPNGGPIGAWSREDIDPLLPPGAFADGKLRAELESLVVFTATGAVVRLTPVTPCP